MNLENFNYIGAVKTAWIDGFKSKKFRLRLLFSIIFLTAVLVSLTQFLTFNEGREGFSFRDPFLVLFDPVELTWITFILIYTAIVIALIYLAKHPDFLIIAMQSYAITASFRMLAMYSIPLDPPETIIPLIDPFVEFFGGGTTLEKDLFFSGHTSTMFILFLTARQPAIRKIFLLLTFLVGLCVLLQHVHYTVDVIIAPFVAFTSYRIALCFNK